jgi:hypothetical protein
MVSNMGKEILSNNEALSMRVLYWIRFMYILMIHLIVDVSMMTTLMDVDDNN